MMMTTTTAAATAVARSAAEVAEAAAGHVYLGDLEDVHSVASTIALPENRVSEIPVLFLDSAIAFPGQVCGVCRE